jgi:lipopolysaccharide transport system permease protein
VHLASPCLKHRTILAIALPLYRRAPIAWPMQYAIIMSQGVDDLDSNPGSHIDETPNDLRVTLIRPAAGWAPIDVQELWEYRDLLYFLIWRDIKVRYKQTILGASWAIIQPFCTMVIFSVVFGQLAHVSSNGLPYPIFSYCALVPWMFFANALAQASMSLVANERMITKIYFPRLLVPLAAVFAGLIDFLISFVVLIGMMLYYHMTPTTAVLATPAFLLLAIATAVGVGVWLAALNVRYRDVRYVVPFLIQFWLFATPIAYSSTLVPGKWRVLYGANPMTGVVEGFRWALLGESGVSVPLFLLSALVVIAVLISGVYYFRRVEQTLADVI